MRGNLRVDSEMTLTKCGSSPSVTLFLPGPEALVLRSTQGSFCLNVARIVGFKLFCALLNLRGQMVVEARTSGSVIRFPFGSL